MSDIALRGQGRAMLASGGMTSAKTAKTLIQGLISPLGNGIVSN